MSRDWATHTIDDAAINAGYDAYPDPPPIEPYELATEHEDDQPLATADPDHPLTRALEHAIANIRSPR